MNYSNIPNVPCDKRNAAWVNGANTDRNDNYTPNMNVSYMLTFAPDINWCGALLPNASPSSAGAITINTSSDLLDLINNMQQEIYTLTAAVIALANKAPAESNNNSGQGSCG